MICKEIENKIDELENSFNEISNHRKNLLLNFSEYISAKISQNEVINLIFICTHNSRRSHMSQIWAQTAAHYFNIPNVKCFSGGTEATSFNPRAVKAIKESGFVVEKNDKSENPIYFVSYSENVEPIKCFSKVYSDEFNPQKNFAAIMTCSDADENCPVVFGAEVRFPIRYNDPKEFDGTDLEELKYRERFEEIGTEMLFTFKNIKID
ncbi:MAG: hypothetical protein WAR79_04520 [Melioribacteraceae bacterium]